MTANSELHGSANTDTDNLEHLPGHGVGRDYAAQHYYDTQHPYAPRTVLDPATGALMDAPETGKRGRLPIDSVHTFMEDVQDVREARATSMLTGQVAVNPNGVQIAYAREERTALVVVNTDATLTVYIGRSQVGAGPSVGFPLPPGATITLSNLAAVWASSASGAPVVGVLDEYRATEGV